MRARLIAGAAVLGAALAAGGAAAAVAATSSPAPAGQPTANDVYFCVNPAGHIDYVEFRGVIPHACWYADEALWHVVASVPAVSPSPSATPTG